MRNKIPNILLVSIAFFLISWGGTGHNIISRSIDSFFNSEMQVFSSWVDYLADHASDADYRKDEDPSEGPKHYFDIDNYPEFVSTGELSMDLQELINKYGEEFVKDNGFLPWATINTYDSLVKSLSLGEIEKAKSFAADLGHYVADGHMPLHLTRNFNGQFTNNDGIHYRYESQMINKFSDEINYEGEEINQIDALDEYVFNYMYENYVYVDSVLLADNYAKSVSPFTDSNAYTMALWEKTSDFTVMLFRKASRVFTEMLYSAWLEAGKPSLTTPVEEFEVERPVSMEIHPNPLKHFGRIEYSVDKPGHVNICLTSLDGKFIQTMVSEYKLSGSYCLVLALKQVPSGIYILYLNTRNHNILRKLIITD